MSKSARHLTDSLPVDDVMKHWQTTNGLLQATNVPWEELPEWRKFAKNAFDISTKMMNKHIGKEKTQCPVCNKLCSTKSNMYVHFRLKHRHLIEVHNIPNGNQLRCPEHLLKYEVEFGYLKRKVSVCMQIDTRKLKKMKEYVMGR